ncbi:MAG: hypothetical protein U0Q15_01885 [Kineosporiaceae bacterium]
MVVEIPDGTHLSDSRGSDGQSPLLRDDETGELVGHATLHPADGSCACMHPLAQPDSRPSALAKLIGEVLLMAVVKGVEALAPHAHRWWDDRALPAIAARWKRVTSLRKQGRAERVDELVAVVASAATGTALDLSAPIGESMTSAEARERWAAALVARAFSDVQFRRLREARIEDEDVVGPLPLDVAGLSQEEVTAAVVRMLKADSSLLDRLLGNPWPVERQPGRRELPPPTGGGAG